MSNQTDAAALCDELRAFMEARKKDAQNVHDAADVVLRPDDPALLDPATRDYLRGVIKQHNDRHLNPAAAVAEIKRTLRG